jgi:hypothetical protein
MFIENSVKSVPSKKQNVVLNCIPMSAVPNISGTDISFSFTHPGINSAELFSSAIILNVSYNNVH